MAALQPILLFIRKNFLSLLCGVIAIASLVVLYWPISNWFADLQTTANARVAAYTTLNSLSTKQRTLPVVDPFNTTALPLNQFPTQKAVDAATNAGTLLASESLAMLNAAKNAVTHTPLLPGALPTGGTMEATEFRDAYQKIMAFPNLDPDKQKLTLPITILHATLPPSPTEIATAQQALKDRISSEQLQYDSAGHVMNADAVTTAITDGQTALPGQMRADAARLNKMYIAPDAIHINPNLVGVNPPSDITMFHAQMSLWLLQDIFTAIAEINNDPLPGNTPPSTQSSPLASSLASTLASTQPATPMASENMTGIPSSMIKHLLKVEYSDTPLTPNSNFDPNAAAAPAADPLHPASNMQASPTGHISNGLYDVVPFSLRIIVDAQSVSDVLAMFSRNRFITVLKVDVLTIDSGQALLVGFIYGPRPVVQLNLSCEELFFRQETSVFMPDPIKKVLGVPLASAAPAGT